MKIALVVATVALLIAAAAMQQRCDQPYVVDVDVVREPGGAWRVAGEIAGCGWRRIEGRSRFEMLLRPGGEATSRAMHGRSVLQVEARMDGGSAHVSYALTVRRGGSVVQREERRIQIGRP